MRTTTRHSATATHNQAGCPYLNQTGYDAVQEWAQVLARIDMRTLPPELQLELQRLQAGCAGHKPSGKSRKAGDARNARAGTQGPAGADP
jgi:hypothetical protein